VGVVDGWSKIERDQHCKTWLISLYKWKTLKLMKLRSAFPLEAHLGGYSSKTKSILGSQDFENILRVSGYQKVWEPMQ
jgi:hypothetical protein